MNPNAPAVPSYRIRETLYRVPSASTPGTVYTVRELPGRYACDCPAGQNRRACWHVRAVLNDVVKPTVRLAVARSATGEIPPLPTTTGRGDLDALREARDKRIKELADSLWNN